MLHPISNIVTAWWKRSNTSLAMPWNKAALRTVVALHQRDEEARAALDSTYRLTGSWPALQQVVAQHPCWEGWFQAAVVDVHDATLFQHLVVDGERAGLRQGHR